MRHRQLDRLSGSDANRTMAPQFTMRPRDRRVQVTFPVRLTCQVIGCPKPGVTWFHKHQQLVPDGKCNNSPTGQSTDVITECLL